MKQHLSLLFFLPLCFMSCLDSPLSDVELTDFSVIKIDCSISQDFLSSSTQKGCHVQISDKNGFGVKIKNGSVTVNGDSLVYDDLFKMYMMPPEGIPVTENTLYTFVITLSNGDTCQARVTTPLSEFGTVIYPSPIHILHNPVLTGT